MKRKAQWLALLVAATLALAPLGARADDPQETSGSVWAAVRCGAAIAVSYELHFSSWDWAAAECLRWVLSIE